MPTPNAADQPVQLRIGFSAPTRPLTISLSLAGLSVLAGSADGSYDEVWQYLTAAGVAPVSDEARGTSFSVRHLRRLAELPDQVSVVTDEVLAPLFALATHPSADELPATLSLDQAAQLRLSWFDGAFNWEEEFDPAATAALLNAELAFVASSEAWDVLKAACVLPMLAGRARMNMDGFVEIATPVMAPQRLVESCGGLAGLFRIDETHFGLSLHHASGIDASAGFVWEGHKPTIERAPEHLPTMPLALSGHHAGDLRSIVDQLAAYRAQAVVWESGLGRRVFALAAVEALDAWPLLVVAPPSAVWVWQRHLELLGRTGSLTHDRADAHIVTYLDLAQHRRVASPQAIIFDDLCGEEATRASSRAALHRLDGLLGTYRITTMATWPAQLEEAVSAMSVLRPGEFRPDVPLAQRYPIQTEQRAREHVEAYLSRRSAEDPDTDHRPFRHSGVITTAPTEAQSRALAAAQAQLGANNPTAVLAECLEIISAGPAHALSPKVALAAAQAREAVAAGRRVALVTRHRRTAVLVRAALRPLPVASLDAGTSTAPLAQGPESVVVVQYETTLPDLRCFDQVVVVDYPWSSETLERAVGAASDEEGPASVSCIHMVGSIDDRLAMLAARRRELGAVIDPTAVPTMEELAYLLSPRPAA